MNKLERGLSLSSSGGEGRGEEALIVPSAPPADSPPPLRRPELLAPAGNWDCARAAIENGADAIYFGLDKFNARMRAQNFTEADLPALMDYLHRRGAKGYLTFNTLIFPDELAEAERYLRALIAAGVDAAVVQDIGIVRLIRQISPDFPIHASTQMTITSAAGLEFARELGCTLVVLARECSIKEIEKIQAAQAAPTHGPGRDALPRVPLQIFVHGALCVAYSGQCLTSEALGGRSANRGECAQACRMPYELLADGQRVDLGDRRYLLSPQDLAGLELLPDLIRAGVDSMKFEGRLKSPEYVASIIRVYRQALDRVFAKLGAGTACPPIAPQDEAQWMKQLYEDVRYDLEMAFSRGGLYTGWLRGSNNQKLVHGRFGTKRGVFLGEVARLQGDKIFIQLLGPLKPGDGVVFDAGQPEEKEEGGRVYQIETRGAISVLAFRNRAINFHRIHPGDKVWKTSDPELDRRLRQSFSGEQPQFARPIDIEVLGAENAPMTLRARDALGHSVELRSAVPLVRAQKQPLTQERLREFLGRLGGTPFRLGEVRNNLQGELILPASELNRLRREMAAQLEALRALPREWRLNPEVARAVHGSADCQSAVAPIANRPSPPSSATLLVLVRTLPQMQAALQVGAAKIYCEFEDPKKYREAVQQFREFAHGTPAFDVRNSTFEIFVAPPRITKPGEEWILKQVRSAEADGYLVRNYDHLKYFSDCRRIGDYSLNVANQLTADYFMRHYGLERITVSYDLNLQQLESLLRAAPPQWFEVTLHQHIPMFHMEHCIFCAFLSQGTDYTNCGRPCERHDVKLRDRVGAEHPVKADAGCRNTVFNALAQTGASYASRLLDLGVRFFRIEFLNESPEQVAQTFLRYRQLLRGEISGADLWCEFRARDQLGVTRGQMEKG